MYLDEDINNAISVIDEGINKFPNRLDMRFGKIYALGQLENWELFTEEVIRTVKYSKINNNKWTWTNNQPKEG